MTVHSPDHDLVERIRRKHAGLPQWWPVFRGDHGDTPDGLTEQDALDAVLEALNSEGVYAWDGDATGIVAQMLYHQYEKRKLAERRLLEIIAKMRLLAKSAKSFTDWAMLVAKGEK